MHVTLLVSNAIVLPTGTAGKYECPVPSSLPLWFNQEVCW